MQSAQASSVNQMAVCSFDDQCISSEVSPWTVCVINVPEHIDTFHSVDIEHQSLVEKNEKKKRR